MPKRTFRYQIEGTVTIDESDLSTRWLEWMSQFRPEHDDPERQADQFAEMASVSTDSKLTRLMVPAMTAAHRALQDALPPGTDCPTPQMSTRPGGL